MSPARADWRLAPSFLSLRKRENMLLIISRAVETSPRAEDMCPYCGVETRSNLIPLRVMGEPNVNGVGECWIRRPNDIITASPIIFES
jgi:hypothetical protein